MRSAKQCGLARLAILAVVGALLGACAMAAEHFVKPAGDDAGAGTSWGSAWKTIQRGVKDLKPGDVLTIAPGVYREQVVVTASGAEGKPILIRAQRPGFSVVKASRRMAGFEPVPGMRFVYRTKARYRIYNVVEADTYRMYLRAPDPQDMDQFRLSYYYDEARRSIYVHTSDGRPATTHVIEATVRHDYGIVLRKAQYVHLEGIVLQGHFIDKRSGHGFGLSMQTAEHCEIRHCTFIANAGGATFNYNCAHNIVRDCLFVGNMDPGYGELAQLYFSAGTEDCQAIRNVVLDAETHGIRFYNGARNCTAIGNIIVNSRIGLYFKATRGFRKALNNVSVGCTYFNFGTGGNPGPMTVQSNTFQQPNWWSANNVPKPDATNLIWSREGPDPKFCDPDHLDFRVQADSPFRAKGPGGKAQGAYPFEGNVFFVSPSGDDANDGLSVSKAWKTLQHGCAAVKAGDTVYLAPGKYAGPLRPASSGTKGKPIVFRSRGKGIQAVVTAPPNTAACDLSGRSHITVQDIAFTGGAEGIGIANGEGVTINRCSARGGSKPAIWIEDASDVDIRFTLAEHPAGAAIGLGRGNHNVSITSSVLIGGSQVLSLGTTPPDEYFLEQNDYFSRTRGPLVAAWDGKTIVGRPVMRLFADLAEWQEASGLDQFSISADPRILNPVTGDVAEDSPLIGMGQFARHIGPGQVKSAAEEKETITEVAVREVTPTTASLTWWTPRTSSALWRSTAGWWVDPPLLSRIHYGTTPACEQAKGSYGDLYHRVTLFDLKPGTKYYYKISLARTPVATAVASFTTPTQGAWKPARRTLYVATDGSDENDGLAPDRAFRTILKASEDARAGDTVVVRDGFYYGMFAPVATGVEDAPIVFMSEHVNRAVLDGRSHVRPCVVALHQKGHVVIDGLAMRRCAPKSLGRRAGLEYSQVLMWGCRHVTVQNCMQWGWGNYQYATVMRWSGNVTLRNNVYTGFEATTAARDVGTIRILGNTWYVPMITNMNLGGFRQGARFVMKNNLFFGQSRQKVSQAKFTVPTDRKMAAIDYNAYVFAQGDTRRYIGGEGRSAPRPGDNGGLKAWQKASGCDLHGVEMAWDQVPFARAPAVGNRHKDFAEFKAEYTRRTKAPTLSFWDLPQGHGLNTAGEGGVPIGARSKRLPAP